MTINKIPILVFVLPTKLVAANDFTYYYVLGEIDVVPHTIIVVDFDQNVIEGTGNIAILNHNSEIVE
ncbi:MAG: hypothetical protein ACJA08_002859 [Cyclobacteriaceae bacterium]